MTVRKTISALGGITALARELGHRNPSTVQGWWERSTIPALRQREVLRAAERMQVAVSADDLLPNAHQP